MTFRVPLVAVDGQVRELSEVDALRYGPEGRMQVTLENVFAGLPTGAITGGGTVVQNGITHTYSSSAGSSASIVASGLELTGGSSAEAYMTSNAGSVLTGLGGGAVAEGRFRRGRWAYWWKIPSITLDSSGKYAYTGIVAAYKQHGFSVFRGRNMGGAQNTADGGNVFSLWWNNTDNIGLITNGSAYDVFCLFFRSPHEVDYMLGTWSSGWPTFESLTYGGTARPAFPTNGVIITSASGFATNGPRPASEFYIPVTAGINTTFVLERYRFTVWGP